MRACPTLNPDAAFEEMVERGRIDDGRDLLSPTPRTQAARPAASADAQAH